MTSGSIEKVEELESPCLEREEHHLGIVGERVAVRSGKGPSGGGGSDRRPAGQGIHDGTGYQYADRQASRCWRCSSRR
jgi:hypothetical protein